jgi:hypothetical protein
MPTFAQCSLPLTAMLLIVKPRSDILLVQVIGLPRGVGLRGRPRPYTWSIVTQPLTLKPFTSSDRLSRADG